MPRSRAAAAAPRLGPGRTDADIFGEARCECYRRCSFGSLWKQWGFLGHGQGTARSHRARRIRATDVDSDRGAAAGGDQRGLCPPEARRGPRARCDSTRGLTDGGRLRHTGRGSNRDITERANVSKKECRAVPFTDAEADRGLTALPAVHGCPTRCSWRSPFRCVAESTRSRI